MTLLEAAATTTDTALELPDTTGWPWYAQLIALAIGGLLLVWGGVKVKQAWKPKAKDVVPPLLMAVALLGLTGCAAGIQKDAARASINVLEPVIHDLEDRAGATESERKANQKQLDTLKEAVK